MTLTDIKHPVRKPYALRRVPEAKFATLMACPDTLDAGDIAIAEVERIARNAHLELPNGRRSALHEGDVLAVVFGNRYATLQFEGYARRDGDACELLSMGGLCGLVTSKHAKIAEPTRLRLLGIVGDEDGSALRLRDFALQPVACSAPPRVMVVCGSSMDAGKTHTVMSAIVGLRRRGYRVAGVKLTGTATGKDTWAMLDAGACTALDFVDGGFGSTYLCTRDQLLVLFRLLVNHAGAQSADWVVVEIADGLLQQETATLLQSPALRSSVDAWVFAAGDPMAAESGIRMLRGWQIEPIAISGVLSMSRLSIREAEGATGVRCYTADELQDGALGGLLDRAATRPQLFVQR